MRDWFEGKSVALVGNSTSLFDKEYGTIIDQHDVVVRLNKAAMLTNRFDARDSHGTRTDIWMFWSVNEYQKHFVDLPDVKKFHAGHQFRTSPKIQLVDGIYPDDMYSRLKGVAGSRRNPTTGFIAIDYIRHSDPRRLSVFGFDWKKTPTHTDPDRVKEKLCPHDYDVEEQYCTDVVFSHPHITLYQ